MQVVSSKYKFINSKNIIKRPNNKLFKHIFECLKKLTKIYRELS